ncbi:MAG: hypothetical protein RLY47_35 [Candidatus Parcubacteria bacterium]|jgi:hypothetical protein
MSKHGTASVSGLFVELMKAVMSALPRNLPEDIAEEWTKNGAALKRALQQALMPPPGERVVISALDVAVAGIIRALRQFFRMKELRGLRIDDFFYTVRNEERFPGDSRRVWVDVTIDGWSADSPHITFRLDKYQGADWILSDPINITRHPAMGVSGPVYVEIDDILMIESTHRFVRPAKGVVELLEKLDKVC